MLEDSCVKHVGEMIEVSLFLNAGRTQDKTIKIIIINSADSIPLDRFTQSMPEHQAFSIVLLLYVAHAVVQDHAIALLPDLFAWQISSSVVI